MNLGAEVSYDVLRERRYDQLSEPLLIAGSSVEQVRDFRRQQGLEDMAFVCVPSPGWMGHAGRGKVLLLLPGERNEAAWDAIKEWVDGEEWTFSVPEEHFDLARAERVRDEEESRRALWHARWWGRATFVAGVICLLLSWFSTRAPGADFAVLPWFVAGCGWVAACVVSGR